MLGEGVTGWVWPRAYVGRWRGQQTGELMYTDDASLQTFMEHLKKLAVQS